MDIRLKEATREKVDYTVDTDKRPKVNSHSIREGTKDHRMPTNFLNPVLINGKYDSKKVILLLLKRIIQQRGHKRGGEREERNWKEDS